MLCALKTPATDRIGSTIQLPIRVQSSNLVVDLSPRFRSKESHFLDQRSEQISRRPIAPRETHRYQSITEIIFAGLCLREVDKPRVIQRPRKLHRSAFLRSAHYGGSCGRTNDIINPYCRAGVVGQPVAVVFPDPLRSF